jgi:ferric-dicitrate binding protein FerR (iron transport regulator)
MQKTYQEYTASDFIRDDAFIRWQLLGEKDDQSFWTHFMEAYPERKEDILFAGKILRSVRLNDYRLSPEEKERLWRKVEKNIIARKKRKTIRYALSAAASVAALLAFAYWVIPDMKKTDAGLTPTVAQTNSFNETDIRLELANRETMILEQDAVIRYGDSSLTVSANNRQLASAEVKKTHHEQEWNKLTVPKGKRTSLILPDGTKIWINSGSYLEFPVRFDADKRAIRVDGEVYVEVSRKEDQPFAVQTPGFEIHVLGTRFNVSAYKDDVTHSVVLVEGKVNVKPSDRKETVELAPDHMLSFSAGKIVTSRVNVYDYISWKDGLLQFHSEPLSLILTRLSRYYDQPITFGDHIKDLKCTGKLVLFDDLTTVLQTITHTVPVKYERQENIIYFSENKTSH